MCLVKSVSTILLLGYINYKGVSSVKIPLSRIFVSWDRQKTKCFTVSLTKGFVFYKVNCFITGERRSNNIIIKHSVVTIYTSRRFQKGTAMKTKTEPQISLVTSVSRDLFNNVCCMPCVFFSVEIIERNAWQRRLETINNDADKLNTSSGLKM